MIRSVSVLFLVLSTLGIKLSWGNDLGFDHHSAEDRSRSIYRDYCASCHGSTMQTFVDRKWEYGDSASAIFESIREGRGGSDAAMPAFSEMLKESQINELVDYILSGIEEGKIYDFEKEFSATEVFKAENFDYTVEIVASNLGIPWGMTFLPKDEILVTDRDGTIYRIMKSGKKVIIRGGPSVYAKGQGGLLDIELHPNFEQNANVYLSYSSHKIEDGEAVSSTSVRRYKLQRNRLTEEKLIFEAFPYGEREFHYGSRIEFDKQGYLFLTVGDRGSRDVNPQDLTRYPGKVHRINDDGSIPTDNPFVDTPGAVKSIYSFGHRNPQGIVIHPETGTIWSHEHGPRGGDEINIIKRGKNYGWPVVSFGINYNGTVFTTLTEKAGMEDPLHYWTPSIGPSGMTFVSGDRYPGWEGHLLTGSLRFEYLSLCKIEGEKVVSESILLENIGRVRNVKQGPDGYVYVATEEPGLLYRITPIKK